MLKQIMNMNEIEGKTINKVKYASDNFIVMSFTDETFICFVARREEYEGISEIAHKTISIIDFQAKHVLIDAGVVTEIEIRMLNKNREIERAKFKEDMEIKEFERLKAKYESGSKPKP